MAFADPRVDAVVISTPTVTHYGLASAAFGGSGSGSVKPVSDGRTGGTKEAV